MIISNPQARLNHDVTDPSIITNVSVTAQISELFGNTESVTQEIVLTILTSEYTQSIAPDALIALIKGKIKDRLESGTLAIHLLNINYNGPLINFKTADTDAKNTLAIESTITITQDEMTTALASGFDGIQSLVKTKLLAEFN
jgi:hypothetical protein